MILVQAALCFMRDRTNKVVKIHLKGVIDEGTATLILGVAEPRR